MQRTLLNFLVDVLMILISAFLGRLLRRAVRTGAFHIRHRLLSV